MFGSFGVRLVVGFGDCLQAGTGSDPARFKRDPNRDPHTEPQVPFFSGASQIACHLCSLAQVWYVDQKKESESHHSGITCDG